MKKTELVMGKVYISATPYPYVYAVTYGVYFFPSFRVVYKKIIEGCGEGEMYYICIPQKKHSTK
jgi:hypothetical protein